MMSKVRIRSFDDIQYVRFSNRFALLAVAFNQSILLTDFFSYWYNFISDEIISVRIYQFCFRFYVLVCWDTSDF